MWNVPRCGDIIELSSAISARHSIVWFLVSRHGRRHWTATPSTSTTTSRLPESDRLPSCGHHSSKLIGLRFPLGDGLGRLLLLYLLVDGFAAARQSRLLSIHDALAGCIEHSTLRTEDLPAYVLMPRQCFRVKRSATVKTLLKAVASSTGDKTVLRHFSIRIGLGSQVIQIV